MPQKDIELILMRQLANYLAVPILVVDSAGTLLFYHEPAEGLLGRRLRGDRRAAVCGMDAPLSDDRRGWRTLAP